MRVLKMLSDRLCNDIEESLHEDKLTPATLEMLDKAVDIIKDIETIEAMREYGNDGYSEGSYRRGRYSRGYDDSYGNISRKMENMGERDRQRVEDFMRQM